MTSPVHEDKNQTPEEEIPLFSEPEALVKAPEVKLKTMHGITIPETWLGYGLVLISTGFFYGSTVAIRWGKEALDMPVEPFVLSRFVVGLTVVSLLLTLQRKPPVPQHYPFLIGRVVTNVAAVYCFFKGVHLTTVANGNILNMTFVLWTAVFSLFIFHSKSQKRLSMLCLPAFAGIALVMWPQEVDTDWNNLWALASGVLAAISIILLNLSRQHDSSETILFYLFSFGALTMVAGFNHQLHWPEAEGWYYLAMCGGLGVVGQYCMTVAFRYITAVEGGIISSLRILLAALLGPILTSDPNLALTGWLGALLIFSTNVLLIHNKRKQSEA